MCELLHSYKAGPLEKAVHCFGFIDLRSYGRIEVVSKNTVYDGRTFKKMSAADFSRSFDVGVVANNNIPIREVADYLMANEGQMETSRPRRQNKRLWESLSDEECRAAQKIYCGFQILVSGSGCKTQSFKPVVDGCRGWVEPDSELVEFFAIWARSAARDISVTSVLDILVFGKSFRDVDRERQKRKGFAKKNLLEGLEIYLKLFK